MVWVHSRLQAISSEVEPNGDWDKAMEVVVQLRLGDEGFVGGHPGVASRHRIGGVASPSALNEQLRRAVAFSSRCRVPSLQGPALPESVCRVS